MTTPTGNCCKNCIHRVRNTDQLDYQPAPRCGNPFCECHISPTDWSERAKQYIYDAINLLSTDLEPELIKRHEDFIESEIASAIERTKVQERKYILKTIDLYSLKPSKGLDWLKEFLNRKTNGASGSK